MILPTLSTKVAQNCIIQKTAMLSENLVQTWSFSCCSNYLTKVVRRDEFSTATYQNWLQFYIEKIEAGKVKC